MTKAILYNGKLTMAEDATPTWEAVLPYLLAAIEDGGIEGRKEARKELMNMAKVADLYVSANPPEEKEDEYPKGIDPTYKQYTLQLVNKKFVFYGEPGNFDDEGNTVMMRRMDMAIVSDNFFANVGLREAMTENNEIEWASNAIKEWWLLEQELVKRTGQ